MTESMEPLELVTVELLVYELSGFISLFTMPCATFINSNQIAGTGTQE